MPTKMSKMSAKQRLSGPLGRYKSYMVKLANYISPNSRAILINRSYAIRNWLQLK